MTAKHLLSEIVAGLDGVTEIPDDIMKAANECVAEFRWNNDNRWHLFVARALLAERERMRSIAAYADRLEKALEQITSVKAEVSNERFRFFALATADAALGGSNE